MPSICICPDCRQRVLVESLADPQLRLRCPLCESTFEAEAVSQSAEPAPPWALPVECESATAAEAGDLTASAAASAPEVAIDTSTEPEVADAEPASLAEIAAAADHGSTAGDELNVAEWQGETADVDSGETEQPAAWDAMSEHADNGLRESARARRREPQIGVLGHLIGVVLGGVIGIGLGYLILLWMAGRQGDFLHIWDQVPRMLLPSEREP